MSEYCAMCGAEYEPKYKLQIYCPKCRDWLFDSRKKEEQAPKKLSDGMKKLLADSRSADALGVSYGQYMGMRAGRVPAKRRRRK